MMAVCSALSRDLIAVNSATNVTIQNNDLVTGKDAISIQDNAGNVDVRFNHIVGNSGYGILRAAGSGIGVVNASANNIYTNRVGYQAICNNRGQVDHNFWGIRVSPSSAITGCTYTTGKQLGAAVLKNTMAPGVLAEEIQISGTKTYHMDDDSIAVDGTPGVKLVIINHGHGSTDNMPFLGDHPTNLIACNHFFDVFISDENTVTPSSMNIYLPYDLEPGCAPIIESTHQLLWQS